ncbi:hypothetical protein C2G38_2214951 [Gigaspora rosea]|uniref:Protein kinase domain-containing protein n=1 Tax=Gigaspora rosea TaxID=44941 RepID=A0A397UDW6_9GLOM|nr:hypothetical protein C2G38_2214951 [Gigaspora rosea]
MKAAEFGNPAAMNDGKKIWVLNSNDNVVRCYRDGTGTKRKQGGFATVYYARWFDRMWYVALKVIRDLKEFIQELKNYFEIGYDNPSFLNYFGYQEIILVIRKSCESITIWNGKINLIYNMV